MASMMLRALSWLTVVGPAARGLWRTAQRPRPATAGLIAAGSMTSAVRMRSRWLAGVASRAGSRTTAVT